MPDLLIRLLITAALLALCFGLGYAKGAAASTKDHQAELAKAQLARLHTTRQIERADTDRSQIVAQQHADATRRQQTVYRTINKEVIRYVAQPRPEPAACHLDADWLRLHDAAATGRLPEPTDATASADATASGPTAAEALPTVIDNYRSCNETAQRLRDLQGWVRWVGNEEREFY
ncbi:hypothetical protein [Parachitinimonas caeni]|uniref:Uncharacterized protein n=1 Tax=Parachitinimonas caeni TaxID=3031301 RepID=A0ABT7DVX5_9NEIS|nr:hypothetical protein [Parachitinimonas caeni]MDK2124139.1 hypothetical protein [Parachitinimonas caeni]